MKPVPMGGELEWVTTELDQPHAISGYGFATATRELRQTSAGSLDDVLT